jgi:16S rRNA processing protein RimM
MTERRPLVVGRIVGVFGVRGEVKLESYTEPRANIFRYQPWVLRRSGEERTLSGVRGREQGKGIVAVLPEVDSREAALAWTGFEILVDRSQLPKAKRGEVYWADLEGLKVVTVDGVELGTVSHLFETGANDVLVVRGERERLVPYLPEQVVKSVDLEAGVLTVDWDAEF